MEVSGQLQAPAAVLPEWESVRGGLDNLEKRIYYYYFFIIVINSKFCDRRLSHSKLKAIVVNTWCITCSPRLVHLYSFCCNIYVRRSGQKIFIGLVLECLWLIYQHFQ